MHFVAEGAGIVAGSAHHQLHAGHIVPGQRQRALHDDGVLAVGVVTRAHAQRTEAERGIQLLRTDIPRPHLERATGRAQVARIGRHVRQQLARDAASPHGRVDAHLEDLHLPVDDPPAGVTRKRFPFISCPPHAVGAGEFVGHERFVPSV